MCTIETFTLNSICNVHKQPTFKSSKSNVDASTCVCRNCKHPPPRMTNTFLSLAKNMQDFGQLLEYAMGDDGHHNVYYDYKHVFQMQLFLEKQIYQNNSK